MNDWVSVADSASLDLSGAMTLEAWVRPATGGGGWRTVVLKEQPNALTYALYSSTVGGPPAVYLDVGSEQGTTAGAGLGVDGWAHLAATYGGGQLRIYVNGNEVATRALAGNIVPSSGALRIGGNGVWPEWFSGLIDEVRVYNRALTQTEIQADLNTAIGP